VTLNDSIDVSVCIHDDVCMLIYRFEYQHGQIAYCSR